MTKWYGNVGYEVTEETRPGIYEERITPRLYYGDVLRNSRRLQNSSEVNSDISISVEISIIADPYAYANFHSIRYVEFMESKWRVDSVDVQYPRLILSLGGLYNDGE